MPPSEADQIMHNGSFPGHHGMMQTSGNDMAAANCNQGSFNQGADNN